MKQVIEKFFCDKCKEEMGKWDYEQATKLTIRVDLANPKGGCGQVSGINMSICDDCSMELGIINGPEFHDYVQSQVTLHQKIKDIGVKFLDFAFKKKDK